MRRLSHTIAELYRKHFAQKLFNKILLTYSLIVILTLAALSFFIYQYFTQYIYNKEMAREQEAVANAGAYLDQRLSVSRMMIEGLYSNGIFLQDFTVLLQQGYQAYLTRTFDRYFDEGVSSSASLKALSAFFDSGLDIDSIVFTGRDGSRYQVNDQLSLEKIADSARPPIPEQGDGYAAQSRLFPVHREEGIGGPLYALATELRNPATLEPIGHMTIRFEADGIMKPNQRLQSDLKGTLLVLTREGEVIYDSSRAWYGLRYPIERLLTSDTSSEQKSDYTVSTANQAGVIVAGILPHEELEAGMQVLKRWIAGLTIVFISGSVLLTYALILRFSRRTKVIVRAMEKLDVGQWNVRIPLSKGDELYQISYNFNQMCERVNHYIEKVYVSEIKQKNAEIVALQMQMNPHFLYNTLESIRMNAVAQGVPEVGRMIFLLATLFRTSMKSAMIVEVAEEIERCRLYLELFQIRFPNRLQVEFDIPGDIARRDILKLSVQPLIENYVLHGFRADRADNRIQVSGRLDAGMLTIRVRDNGKGMPLPELLKLRQSLGVKSELEAEANSIGLQNVNMRLQMVYGGEYGLEIDSIDGEGADVVLRLPAVGKE